jgi:TIR domain
MSSEIQGRTKVFISYSHTDAAWLERLRVHLKPLKKTIDLWDDGRIAPGAVWLEEIRAALDAARVAVLLVSADFLASDFITTEELPALLKSAREGGTEILIVVLSPSQFSAFEALSRYQTVNDPKQPLIGLDKVKQEEVFVTTASLVELSFKREPSAAVAPTPPASDDGRAAAGDAPPPPSDCRDYANIFDIHIRRERKDIPVNYAASLASLLFGLALLAGAWLMSTDIRQNIFIMVLMLAVAVAAFAFTYVLWRKIADTQMAIESSKFMKQRFDGCERWDAGELRENVRLALEFVKGGMQRP